MQPEQQECQHRIINLVSIGFHFCRSASEFQE
jgi:hypothetical protein